MPICTRTHTHSYITIMFGVVWVQNNIHCGTLSPLFRKSFFFLLGILHTTTKLIIRPAVYHRIMILSTCHEITFTFRDLCFVNMTHAVSDEAAV